jgi:hypothetical protein
MSEKRSVLLLKYRPTFCYKYGEIRGMYSLLQPYTAGIKEKLER